MQSLDEMLSHINLDTEDENEKNELNDNDTLEADDMETLSSKSFMIKLKSPKHGETSPISVKGRAALLRETLVLDNKGDSRDEPTERSLAVIAPTRAVVILDGQVQRDSHD